MANQVAGSQTKLAADVEALNSKITPALTMATGFVAASDFSNYLVVLNRVAVLNFVFWTAQGTEMPTQAWLTVATIPSGYRPSSNIPCSVSILGTGHASGNVYDGRITTAGEIQIYPTITTIPGRAIMNVCYDI